MRYGRKEPYTEEGIKRIPCTRCGNTPSKYQWNICSDGNLFRPLCQACDLLLNRMMLAWMNDPDAEVKYTNYEYKLTKENK